VPGEIDLVEILQEPPRQRFSAMFIMGELPNFTEG